MNRTITIDANKYKQPQTPDWPNYRSLLKRYANIPLLSVNNWRRLVRGRIPGQVVIQFTDQCNATCAQCGMRRTNPFPRSALSVDRVKRLIDAMVERGITAISFTGGEPFLYFKEIVECTRYARSVGIRYARTGTNGYQFQRHQRPDYYQKIHRLAESMADSGFNTFWISIDSADASVHESNRGLPDTIAGIEKALPIFEQYGVYPSANLGINRYFGGSDATPSDNDMLYEHYRRAFGNFYSRVWNMGFTIVNSCYPMDMDEGKNSAVFTATSKDQFIRFAKREKLQLFRAMFDAIPEFRQKLRIFTPRSALRSLIQQYQGHPEENYACRGGIDFFFIDAKDMDTYPCGFRGEENLGKFWDLDVDDLQQQAWCRQCDWECFRDPSELLSPLLELTQKPISLAHRFLRDADYRRLWIEDMRYFYACDYFDALTPPNPKSLAAFAN